MTTKFTSLPATVTGDGSQIRSKFNDGQSLQADDLTQTVDYPRDMTRLLFRSMLGCGVLCGFRVKPSIICEGTTLQIIVSKGVALDCRGELIELPSDETIQYAPPCPNGTIKLPDEVWVLICHKERDCAPRDVLCSTQDGETAPVYTRTREGYQIKVLEVKAGDQPPGCCACTSTFDEPTQQSANTCCDYIAIPDPTDQKDCYAKHYSGDCFCECTCDCIVLARVIVKTDRDTAAYVDHSVRRYIRPVLMKDPLPMNDKKPPTKASPAPAGGETPAKASPQAKPPKKG